MPVLELDVEMNVEMAERYADVRVSIVRITPAVE